MNIIYTYHDVINIINRIKNVNNYIDTQNIIIHTYVSKFDSIDYFDSN